MFVRKVYLFTLECFGLTVWKMRLINNLIDCEQRKPTAKKNSIVS